MSFRAVRSVLWVLAFIALAGFGGYKLLLNDSPQTASSNNAEEASLNTVNQDEETPIGGPFELINHKGETVTQDSYKGRYMMIFFGYTYCPDICPFELATISQALDLLEEDNVALDGLQPIFVSIDPERDTVDTMALYMEAFHPRLVGLTGSVDQVNAMTDVYSVYASKVVEEENENYLMNHSSLIYLMGPDGKYVGYFPPGRSPEIMASGLKKLLTDNAG